MVAEKRGLNRRTPKEVIESTKDPQFEESWYKFPKKEPQVNSVKRKLHTVSGNYKRMYEEARQIGNATNYNTEYRATGIHTHPVSSFSFLGGTREDEVTARFPSSNDLMHLLATNSKKSEIIARVNKNTGKLLGYTVIRKTAKTIEVLYPKNYACNSPVFTSLFNLSLWKPDTRKISSGDYNILKYKKAEFKTGITGNSSYLEEGLKEFCERYHLQYKFIPVKRDEQIAQRPVHAGLESKAVAASIVLLLASFIVSAVSITGNIINYGNSTSYNIFGTVLFISGLIALYFARR